MFKRVGLLCAALLLAGCTFLERPAAVIPTEVVRGNGGKTLVVVLPGLGDNLRGLKNSGIAAAIHQAMPGADVQLVGLTLTYYSEGRAVQRLHDEVIAPAQQKGYRDIYLTGASMGGMGVLMYEREHPGVARGLILLAPYMGEQELIAEIMSAGGLEKWNPGPVPAQLNRDNVPREEWRLLQSWLRNGDRARDVWLVCGRSDRFHEPAQLVAAVLPREQYIALDGGHAWTVWNAGAREVFGRIASAERK